jgi:hypothetical protein
VLDLKTANADRGEPPPAQDYEALVEVGASLQERHELLSRRQRNARLHVDLQVTRPEIGAGITPGRAVPIHVVGGHLHWSLYQLAWHLFLGKGIYYCADLYGLVV